MSDPTAFRVSTDALSMGDEVPIVILASEEEDDTTVILAQGKNRIVLSASMLTSLYFTAMQTAVYAGHIERVDA